MFKQLQSMFDGNMHTILHWTGKSLYDKALLQNLQTYCICDALKKAYAENNKQTVVKFLKR